MSTSLRGLTGALAPIWLLATVCATGFAEQATSAEERPVRTRQQIEADWLRQDVVRNLSSGHEIPILTPEEDAPGACDGVRNGKYGFHTGNDQNPWWQVDLGESMPLGEVRVFNRGDGSQARAAQLKVLLSDDAATWNEVYQHDGTPFLGHADDKPLSVKLEGAKARFLRIQLPGQTYLHLDEVEVYALGGEQNVALKKPATQSSASPWSTKSAEASPAAKTSQAASPEAVPEPAYPIAEAVQRGLLLAESLHGLGVKVDAEVQTLRGIAERVGEHPEDLPPPTRRELYLQARWTAREMAFRNPLLDFDDLLLVKRTPARFTTSPDSRTYTHMSDQYYGWFSRPGGGLYVMEGFKTDQPRLRPLTEAFPPGNIVRPDVSHDGTKVLFAFCKFYPDVHGMVDKLDKSKIPEDALNPT
ncbi:MAG: discoidin domain-containing protein [Planctomycetota bacterium]